MSTAHLDTAVETFGLEPADPAHDRSLGPLLVATDTVAMLVAAGIVWLAGEATGPGVIDLAGPLFVPAVVVVGLVVITALGLHQRRKCAVAAVEISRIGRGSAIGAVIALLLLQAADSRSPYLTSILLGGTTFTCLTLTRTWFRTWLRGQRLDGRFLTRVAVVGQRGASQDFARHMRGNLDGGFLPVAHVDVDSAPLVDLSDTADLLPRVGHLWQEGTEDELADAGVHSAVLLADGLDSERLREVVRVTENGFAHVQVVTNLVGFAHTRLVPTPLVGELTFYLEPLAAPWQRVVKRALDVLVSGFLLVGLLPLLGLLALAVRLPDGGPALYSQERVGRAGRRIRIWKFRSMVVDADQQDDTGRGDNERAGPLFKARRDPRVTRIGRWLRATSLDELPQLWSILVGDMSLVGPRPALPAEVAEFDRVHRRRHEVRPGLTGLWQVEDRDHPDFQRYRRHDVFYVENWSLSLDLAILVQTAAVVIMRAVRAVFGGDEHALE